MFNYIMHISKNTVINIIFPFISGIAAAISYYSEKLSFLIFISLIPYIYSMIYNFSYYKSFIYSIPLYSISLIWISNISSKVTDNLLYRILISILLIFALSFILSLFLNAPFYILKFNSYSKIQIAAIFPFLYIFGEWLQGIFIPIAFPWIKLGNIASHYILFIQSASILGTLFISLLILLINMSITLFFYFSRYKIKYLFLFSALLIMLSNLTFGYNNLIDKEKNKNPASSVVIIQGNYPKESKFTSSPDEMLDKYLDLIYSEKLDNVDLILFPETSMHSDIYTISNLKTKLFRLCSDLNSLLLFGSQYNKEDKFYNACMAIYPDNKIDAVYLKRILVPFGEYNPFNIKSIRFISTDFSAGEECSLIKFDAGFIGCAICFESVFPEAVSECVKNGAQVITILTNDSWLGEKIPIYQHHSHSIMRAVENNRYVLTSTNTGISSIINNKGEIISQSDLNTEAVINGKFYINDKLSFYTQYGDIIIIPSCFIIIFTCIKFIINQISALIFKKT